MTETLVSWCSRLAEPHDRPVLLEVSGLTKSFGPLTGLREVSLQVGHGEIVAVAGGNGAGKSTLIGTIAGVLDADAGEVRFAGRPMPSRPGQVRRAGVETVWQEHGLCDDLDAVANIFLGRPGRWVVPESALREQAATLLRRVGARDLRLDVPIRVLSRGQRQLVAVAGALLTPPRLLVMDEPTASLGVAETALVESILREAREAGVSVLLATHDLEQVFTLADRIVVLRDGAAVADVSPVEAQRSEPRGTDVTVRAGGPPGWAEVEITDYGAGIPAGLAEKIFEPRVRGTTELAGTGLGLPIARGIVEAHGGTLVVAPADPGASCVVALPADPPSGTTGEPAGASWSVVEEPEEQRGG